MHHVPPLSSAAGALLIGVCSPKHADGWRQLSFLLHSSSSQSLSVSSSGSTATAYLKAAVKLASACLMSSSDWCPTCATGPRRPSSHYYDDYFAASKKLPFASSPRIAAGGEPRSRQYHLLASDPSSNSNADANAHDCGGTATAREVSERRTSNSCLSPTSTCLVIRCEPHCP